MIAVLLLRAAKLADRRLWHALGLSVHLRLEDTVLITPGSAEKLTASAPAGIEEIYALIRQQALGVN